MQQHENNIEHVPETLDEAVSRLASLTPLQYDQTRKDEAKQLGVRPATLDSAVKDVRKKTTDSDLPFTEDEPWHEPVNLAELLTCIAKTIRRFIVCQKETADAVALWIAMTWVVDVIQVAPLAVITAPEKRCGKSMMLSLIGKLSARSLPSSSISPAALFRAITAWKPTILLDETDATLKDNEELRGLINSGHTRDSAFVIRCEGDDHTPKTFSTWCAKALAGIGHIADTLMDRAIILELRRKLPHENVERIRHAEPDLFDTIRSKLARFAEDYSSKIKTARPPLPETLNDRAQDNWEPLLAIAMIASDEWLKIGTSAALRLAGEDSNAQTIGIELLIDIKEIFDDRGADRIRTKDLIDALCEDDEKPWCGFNKGKEMSPRQLANRLKPYSIASKQIRIGISNLKGYEKQQFEDAFLRYIPTYAILSATPKQDSNNSKLGENISDTETSAFRIGNTSKPSVYAGCSGVADRNTTTGHCGKKETITKLKADDFNMEMF